MMTPIKDGKLRRYNVISRTDTEKLYKEIWFLKKKHYQNGILKNDQVTHKKEQQRIEKYKK